MTCVAELVKIPATGELACDRACAPAGVILVVDRPRAPITTAVSSRTISAKGRAQRRRPRRGLLRHEIPRRQHATHSCHRRRDAARNISSVKGSARTSPRAYPVVKSHGTIDQRRVARLLPSRAADDRAAYRVVLLDAFPTGNRDPLRISVLSRPLVINNWTNGTVTKGDGTYRKNARVYIDFACLRRRGHRRNAMMRRVRDIFRKVCRRMEHCDIDYSGRQPVQCGKIRSSPGMQMPMGSAQTLGRRAKASGATPPEITG